MGFEQKYYKVATASGYAKATGFVYPHTVMKTKKIIHIDSTTGEKTIETVYSEPVEVTSVYAPKGGEEISAEEYAQLGDTRDQHRKEVAITAQLAAAVELK